ncbi:MAG: dihydrolipoyl dehydrogenase [Sedimentisphaerales bacterium]|nr:dihydrolipoyl dehydrogenase [Sedimentisphaerales bacterium]
MTEHYQIAVLGAGPGGYVAALKAAQMGAKTAIIEKHHLGGTCLNYGCIPSKALLASAELIHKIHRAGDYGINVSGGISFDWAQIQKRKDKVLTKLRGGIKSLFGARKVTLYAGQAAFAGHGKIQITDSKGEKSLITADKVIIATGSVPARIPGWPTDSALVCTSDESLHWKELSKKLLIVGGGVIGCEFACMMHEYGVEVTMVELMETLLPEMERQVGVAIAEIFSKRGMKIYTGVKVEELQTISSGIKAILSGGKTVEADKVLVATGRRPATQDLGLESIGLTTDRGFIRVNDRMQTAAKDVYCIGDANGRCLLAHAASAHGVAAVEDALGHGKDFTLPIPGAVYTFPEIGTVGLTSRQAVEKDIPVKVGQFPIGFLGKAMAVGEEEGFVKVIRHRDSGALLGVHVLGHNATEIIESAAAMLGLKASAADLAEMVFAHPTLGEAVKEAAEDSFDQALHLPPRSLVKITAEAKEIK